LVLDIRPWTSAVSICFCAYSPPNPAPFQADHLPFHSLYSLYSTFLLKSGFGEGVPEVSFKGVRVCWQNSGFLIHPFFPAASQTPVGVAANLPGARGVRRLIQPGHCAQEHGIVGPEAVAPAGAPFGRIGRSNPTPHQRHRRLRGQQPGS
jgi:hypothetical protein